VWVCVLEREERGGGEINLGFLSKRLMNYTFQMEIESQQRNYNLQINSKINNYSGNFNLEKYHSFVFLENNN